MSLLLPRYPHADPIGVLPIAFHVVQEDAKPVVSDALLRERLDRANQIVERYGVRFEEVSASTTLPTDHALIQTRAQRDALSVQSEG